MFDSYIAFTYGGKRSNEGHRSTDGVTDAAEVAGKAMGFPVVGIPMAAATLKLNENSVLGLKTIVNELVNAFSGAAPASISGIFEETAKSAEELTEATMKSEEVGIMLAMMVVPATEITAKKCVGAVVRWRE